MPPPPKPADRRQRRNQRDVGLVVVDSSRPEIPPAPRGLLKITKGAWAEFWSSPVAELVDRNSDMPALTRLFGFYDEAERAVRSFRREPFVEGSKGQPVFNPMGDRPVKLEPLIRSLEDRFGLTPMARLKLGVTFGSARRSLEDLNRGWHDSDEDEAPEDDPRLGVIDVG